MIMSVLQAAYPAFYRDFSKEDLNGIVNLWTELFKDDDVRSVMAATQALITTKTEGYPPTIGAVKEQLHKIHHPDEMSEQEAWRLVSKACQNAYFNATAEFEKLPEVIQRSIGGPEQLRAWSQMDSETVESVVASNFMRTFRIKQTQQKELDMMPTEVKQYMSAVAEKLALEKPERKQLEKPKIVYYKAEDEEEICPPNLEQILPPHLAPKTENNESPNSEQRLKWRENSVTKTNVPKSEPLSPEEWARKRDEAIAKLMSAKEAREANHS